MKRYLPLLLLLLLAPHLHAQVIFSREGAKHAANRGNVQVGIAGSYLRPDYGPGVGGMLNPYAALDFKRSIFGAEVDYNRAIDVHSAAKPNTIMFGMRVGGYVGPFRLYFKPAIGRGHFSGVTTAPSGGSENYLVYELGGGADMEVTYHLNARFFGAYQVWPGFDGDTTPQYDHKGVLNPIFAGVGLAYHFQVQPPNVFLGDQGRVPTGIETLVWTAEVESLLP